MNRCKYCGKPLTLTPEFDTCMECQGRIMRETIYGNNGGFATNSTKTATKVISHEEARKLAKDMLPKQVGSRSSQNKVNKYFELDLYFKQQEKKNKLLELYQEKEKLSKNPYKNIDTKEMKPYFEWACELVALEEKIKALEEEIK